MLLLIQARTLTITNKNNITKTYQNKTKLNKTNNNKTNQTKQFKS